jgi:hypothetical protein
MDRARGPLGIDLLEHRRLLAAIDPTQLYTTASFTSSHGDTVDVSIQGAVGSNAGFTLALAGGASDNADIGSINLLGLDAGNSLSIRVTPNPLTITGGGGNFAQIFSSGYVNVTRIGSTADSRFPGAAPITALGGLHLSAAVTRDIALSGVTIGDITVDAGKVAYVDRVNAANLSSISIAAPSVNATGNATVQEILDESPTGQAASYVPRIGLIGLRNLSAQAVSTIVINGATPLTPNNSFDQYNTMNDFDGTIVVTASIGSLVGPQSVLKGRVVAGSIGRAELAAINGSITTTDASQPFTISLPEQFSGFISSAGHLNVGFPQPTATSSSQTDAARTAAMLNGQILSGGGISGVDPGTTADTILVPSGYPGVVVNTSLTAGISDMVVNGFGSSSWTSASSIGSVTADVFTQVMVVRAGTDVGPIRSRAAVAGTATAQQPNPAPLAMAGHFQAGRDIGDVLSVTGIDASLIAGRNIGSITSLSGGLGSAVVTAGRDIGAITAFQTAVGTTPITAGGTIASLQIRSGSWSGRMSAQDIGTITVDSGSLRNAIFAAAGSIGDVSVTAPQGIAIDGGSIVAGDSVGAVRAVAAQATAIRGTLIQAGSGATDAITSVTGISYGTAALPVIAPNPLPAPLATSNGIDGAHILGGQIGAVTGTGYGGAGIVDALVHAQFSDIVSITGSGNADGILRLTAVAEGSVGAVKGTSWAQGRGISGSSIDANGGDIGTVIGLGGPAGGAGLDSTRLQAFGRIAGISGTANANGGDAINKLSAYAASIGEVRGSVLGGQTGNGLVDSTIKAWTNFAGTKPSVQLDGIFVDVRSATGAGILRSTVGVKGDLVAVVSKALGAAAISTSTFETSGGDIGRISAESINSGTAIDMSSFTAHNGSIGSAQSEGEVATKGVSAKAGSSSPLAHGISGSFFTADGNIGFVVATANGGCGITGSTYLADADAGNSNNGPNLEVPAPSDDLGAIFGIHATTSGQNGPLSVGINASTFTGELISSITVDVTNREEGGAGILASTFTARNAVADGNGNFNNTGTIGAITVTNNSLRGNGIETSRFSAGAAGSIGDITVTTLGGTGIKGSFFQASAFDLDQNRFTSSIGNIRVRAGRTSTLIGGVAPNDGWTLLAAGIDSCYFAANAGIGNIDVQSVGTSIFFSAFLADFDVLGLGPAFPYSLVSLLGQNTPGSIGNVTVTSTGRFGSGVVLSAFAGAGVGDVRVNVSCANLKDTLFPARASDADNPILQAENRLETLVGQKNFRFVQQDRYGLAGVAGSLFLATDAGIGQISVTNGSATGISSVFSAYVSLGTSGAYGPVRFNPPAPRASIGWWIFKFDVPTNFLWGKQRTSVASTSVTPTVSSIGLPAAARYKAGSNLLFTVTFDRPVTVVGTPTLPLTLGASPKAASYVGGSGTDTLTFRYTVAAGDNASAGIAVGSSVTQSIDSRIVDLATSGNDPSLNLPVVDGSRVVVDTTAPEAVGAVQPQLGPYVAGRTIEARVRFTEAVAVSGVPSLPLFFGTQVRAMRFSRVEGIDVVFSYVVKAADVTLRRHARTNGVVGLTGGSTISDLAGNAATPRTQPLADPQAPVVLAVTAVAGPASGPFKAGDRIKVSVTYEAPMYVSGKPTIAFTMGQTPRKFTYLAGSGTRVLTFSYTLARADLALGAIAVGSQITLPVQSAIRGLDGVAASLRLA